MNKKLGKILFGLTFLGATGIFYSCMDDSGTTAVFETKESIEPTTVASANATEDTKEVEEDTSQQEIYVYVCGQVKNPGVYTANSGARAVELIEAAGGFTKDAATEQVNLASIVTDEQMLYIPSTKEVESGSYKTSSESGQATESKEEESGKININTASKEELMTIPGIGESKAASILSYRESNGSFSSIEDIMNVSGIKSGVFEKIKDYITVE